MTLLTIDNLSVRFTDDQAAKPAVDKVSLTVGKGDTVALVGESGSGKSVTALTVLRLLESVARVETSGSVIYKDQELLTMSEDEVRQIRGNRIAMVFQEPMTSLNPVYTVGHQLLEPLILHQQMTRDKAKSEAIRLLDRCGISEAKIKFDHFPHQLSGGQRQRVMLAMALACRPDLLIADEPTTALDVTIQAQILALIKEIQIEMGMAILLITHDLVMVQKIASRVYIMKQGKVIESGVTETIFNHPQDAYTKELLASVPRRTKKHNNNEKIIISAKNIIVDFCSKTGFFSRKAKGTRAVDTVNIDIRQGTTFGIVGESGSGKSTLGLALLRLLSASGEVNYGTINLLRCPPRLMRRYRRDLQIVFQDPFSSLSPRQTIGQIVGEGLRVHEPAMTKNTLATRVEKALIEVGLDPQMISRYPHEFSGGQRQRIAIARSIVLKPHFLVLDEPTSALDMTIQAQIIDLLRKLQDKYQMTYLFISHDLRVVRALADDLAVMQRGKIVEQGNAEAIFSAPQHSYTKALLASAFFDTEVG